METGELSLEGVVERLNVPSEMKNELLSKLKDQCIFDVRTLKQSLNEFSLQKLEIPLGIISRLKILIGSEGKNFILCSSFSHSVCVDSDSNLELIIPYF